MLDQRLHPSRSRERKEKSVPRSIKGNGRGEAVTSRRYGTRNRITSQA